MSKKKEKPVNTSIQTNIPSSVNIGNVNINTPLNVRVVFKVTHTFDKMFSDVVKWKTWSTIESRFKDFMQHLSVMDSTYLFRVYRKHPLVNQGKKIQIFDCHITGDCVVLYSQTEQKDGIIEIELRGIGTHSQLKLCSIEDRTQDM